jgi:GNAT superfamily N-acetyltransferase
MIVGRYDVYGFERPMPIFPDPPTGVLRRVEHPNELADLAHLGVRQSQAKWLDQGSECIWVPAPDGSPGAVMWGHVSNHVDRYLGAWSKPGNGMIYISGYQTAEQWRGKGLGMLLLFEASYLGRERGVERLRSAAAASNAASVKYQGANILTWHDDELVSNWTTRVRIRGLAGRSPTLADHHKARRLGPDCAVEKGPVVVDRNLAVVDPWFWLPYCTFVLKGLNDLGFSVRFRTLDRPPGEAMAFAVVDRRYCVDTDDTVDVNDKRLSVAES